MSNRVSPAILSSFCGLILLSLASPAAAEEPTFEARFAPEALEMVNKARSEDRHCGDHFMPAAPPLRWSDELAEASQIHSDDMRTSGRPISHNGSDRSTPRDRVNRVTSDFNIIGENIQWGTQTTEGAVGRLLDSPGHCINIMNPNFTHFGMAVNFGQRQFGNMEPRPWGYWTQVFGRDRNENSPVVSTPREERNSCHIIRARTQGSHPDEDEFTASSPASSERTDNRRSERVAQPRTTQRDPSSRGDDSGLESFIQGTAERGIRFGIHAGGSMIIDEDAMTGVQLGAHRLALGLQVRVPNTAEKRENSFLQWAAFFDAGASSSAGLGLMLNDFEPHSSQGSYAPFWQVEAGAIFQDLLRLSGGVGAQHFTTGTETSDAVAVFSATAGFSIPVEHYNIELLGSALFHESSTPTYQAGARIGFVFGPRAD